MRKRKPKLGFRPAAPKPPRQPAMMPQRKRKSLIEQYNKTSSFPQTDSSMGGCAY